MNHRRRRTPCTPSPRSLVLATLVLLLVPGLTVFGQPSAGGAQDTSPAALGKREVRAALRQAETALAGRQLDQAAALYEQVLAASPAGDERRAEALYGLALAERLRPAEARDPARLETLLRELSTSFPNDEHRLETAAALADLEQLNRAFESAERLALRVAELEADLEASLEQQKTRLAEMNAASDGRAEAMETETASLRGEVEELRRRLAAVEVELQKKEEALEKVKATLVGG